MSYNFMRYRHVNACMYVDSLNFSNQIFGSLILFPQNGYSGSNCYEPQCGRYLIMGCWGPSIVSPLGVEVLPLVEDPGEDLHGGPSYVEVLHFLMHKFIYW